MTGAGCGVEIICPTDPVTRIALRLRGAGRPTESSALIAAPGTMDDSDQRSAPMGGVPRTRLLLVDDEPELRRVFRRSLERAGYFVVEAADGKAALELSRRMDFEVVVSDVCMPLMTGLELLERLSVETPNVAVLFVSGSTSFMDLETAQDCGAFDFLQKPVNLAELRARAALAAEESRRRRAAATSARDSETRLLTPVIRARTAES